ncbi:membrane protein of unknown function [Modestobacter italicus]|uniref:Transmembrane protein n=1 Tax=Modestobacter italicus (strain DSM 44449 / CECT 9708 / BC 501) TaxID=2732864 RepID=I4ERE0_MODI5|nr:hypothetical protein [Modestobacter marinus]CCH85953.1 membrane protein of unknown function [Modestobacter marinus]
MSLPDKMFAPAGASYRVRYLATWVAMVPSAFVAVAGWFAPAAVPAGHLMISLIGAAMFAFCVWANRQLHRRMQAEDAGERPATEARPTSDRAEVRTRAVMTVVGAGLFVAALAVDLGVVITVVAAVSTVLCAVGTWQAARRVKKSELNQGPR